MLRQPSGFLFRGSAADPDMDGCHDRARGGTAPQEMKPRESSRGFIVGQDTGRTQIVTVLFHMRA
ncbi:MAG: hypothetical protein OEO77_10685 [Acidimicrobiia bacterium]|nr:hypothetical protein [Acidimicrobiia bacterium]